MKRERDTSATARMVGSVSMIKSLRSPFCRVVSSAASAMAATCCSSKRVRWKHWERFRGYSSCRRELAKKQSKLKTKNDFTLFPLNNNNNNKSQTIFAVEGMDD